MVTTKKFPITHISSQLLNAIVEDNCINDDDGEASNDNCLQDMFDCDDFLPLEDDTVDTRTHVDGIGIVERVGPLEYVKRLMVMRSALGDPSEWGIHTSLDMLPESSNYHRNIGDLCWHRCYHMSELYDTILPPMRYACCDPTLSRCFHKPHSMLQVFYIKLKTNLQDVNTPIQIYGFIATRDAEDYHRNYIFNRSQAHPLTVNPTSDYLTLMSPTRGVSMSIDCLIEVDIRVKGAMEDVILVDGCSVLYGDRAICDLEVECTMEGSNASLIFDFIVFQRALEATVQLDFLKVSIGGFEVKMCAYTAVSKNLYNFIGEQCDCESFISSVGKYRQNFVAAVPDDDTIFIDFMEGKLPIPFKATIHGSHEKEYHFHNSAVVSIKVSWSTIFY